jgi:hypothetical protein
MGAGGMGGPSPLSMSSEKIYPADQPMVFNPQNPNAPPIYPCGICHKEVHDNDQVVFFYMHFQTNAIVLFLGENHYVGTVPDTGRYRSDILTVWFFVENFLFLRFY